MTQLNVIKTISSITDTRRPIKDRKLYLFVDFKKAFDSISRAVCF